MSGSEVGTGAAQPGVGGLNVGSRVVADPEADNASAHEVCAEQEEIVHTQPATEPMLGAARTSNISTRPTRTATLSLVGQESQIYQLTLRMTRELNTKFKALDSFLRDDDCETGESLTAKLDSLNDECASLSDLYNDLSTLSGNKIGSTTETMFVDYQSEAHLIRNALVARIKEIEQQESEKEELRAMEASIEEAKRELEEQKRIYLEIKEARTRRNNHRHISLHSEEPEARQQVRLGEPAATITTLAGNHSSTDPQHRNPRRSNDTYTHGSSQLVARDVSETMLSPIQPSLPESRDSDNLDVVRQLTLATNSLANVASTMAKKSSKSVEPELFKGDALNFLDWEVDLEGYFRDECIEGADRLRHLKKFVAGDARKSIEGLFPTATNEAYEHARAKLKERYGNRHTVSKSFRKKLDEWPKLNARDGKGLQDFGDFLSHVCSAMVSMASLKILNDCNENSKLVEKLPDWLRNRWWRQVDKTDQMEDRYPSFREFAEFVQEEARVMMRAESSVVRISQTNRNPTTSKERPHGIRNFSTATTKENTCLFCTKMHKVGVCFQLQSKPYQERLEFYYNNQLCFGCSTPGHRSRECNSKESCKKCHKPHPTVLHNDDWKPRDRRQSDNRNEHTQSEESKEEVAEGQNSTPLHAKVTNMGQEVMSMALPVFVSAGGEEALVYALLDTGSDSSFITKAIADVIKPRGTSENVTVYTLNGDSKKRVNVYSDITIRGYLTSAQTVIDAYEQDHIYCDSKQIPTKDKAKDLAHLHVIADQLPSKLDIPIGILIGADYSDIMFPKQSICGAPGQTFAIETMFGWTLCGGGKKASTSQIVYKTDTDKEILQLLEKDFNDMTTDGQISQEDMKFLQLLHTETKQDQHGNFILPLPFKDHAPLPVNRAQAEKRLEQLIKKLRANAEYKREYFKFMNALIVNGHAEEVPSEASDPDSGSVWFIPHFAVTHPKKKKLRVVFDASAKFKGIALNDILLQGPDMVNSLVGILLRFRKEQIAVCCDIEKMFYNFYVPSEQRDYLRFLWVNEDLSQVKEYRMTVHLFGAKSSPAVATFALRKLAAVHEQFSPEAAAFLKEDFYVDDGIASMNSRESAVKLIKEAIELCARGNVRLHKFISNDREVMSAIPQTERSESTQNIDLEVDQLPNERTLGLEWNVEKDAFHFKLNIMPKPVTKRGVLSTVAQIYDPLGFTAPFVLKGKQLLQKVTAAKIPWDDPLPTEHQDEWSIWLSELPKLDGFHIERWMQAGPEVETTEFHHFSDASSTGYGACSYLRQVKKDGTIHCTLMFAKARVAPLKPVTIPRLELQAAVTAVRIRNILVKELSMTIDKEYFWCDSQVVLGYIKNESRRFHMYVANRVHEIKQSSDSSQWHYVRSADNPADMVSRGIMVGELLDSTWRTGPAYLKQPDLTVYMKENEIEAVVYADDLEVKNVKALTTSVNLAHFSERFCRYSNWNSLVRSLALVKRCARTRKEKTTPALTPQDLWDTERFIIKSVQSAAYTEEIRNLQTQGKINNSSSLTKLSVFLDEDGLLRVGGRLQNGMIGQGEKTPVIIPKHSHLAKLLIDHFHAKIHHLGRRSTLAAIREAGYWIISGTAATKAQITRCVTCAKLRQKPQSQKMANLPDERLQSVPPFTHVGMDVFGPYQVKDRRTTLKRYGLMFTCMYSRAVHIEMLEDLSSNSFINALRCLTALRGQVSTLHSDNGTNFVGAKNLFDRELGSVADETLKRHLLENRIEFKMNSPDASHQGGVWERLIRSARAVLNGMSQKYRDRLDSQTLRTAFYEVTSVLNNKPLTATDIGSPTEQIITPNQLLTMKTGFTPAPPPGRFTDEEIYGRAQWRKAQQLADDFYRTWKSEYLSEITKRQKWTQPRRNAKIGDVVLLQDNSVSRNCWNLGVVDAVHEADDGHVRNVTLRMANRNIDMKGIPYAQPAILQRPIHKTVLLVSA